MLEMESAGETVAQTFSFLGGKECLERGHITLGMSSYLRTVHLQMANPERGKKKARSSLVTEPKCLGL